MTERWSLSSRALYARWAELGRAAARSSAMTPTETTILAEAERGPVACRLYKGYGERDDEGFARDRLCSALADAGRLKLSGIKGSRTSPFGMVRTWVRA